MRAQAAQASAVAMAGDEAVIRGGSHVALAEAVASAVAEAKAQADAEAQAAMPVEHEKCEATTKAAVRPLLRTPRPQL